MGETQARTVGAAPAVARLRGACRGGSRRPQGARFRCAPDAQTVHRHRVAAVSRKEFTLQITSYRLPGQLEMTQLIYGLNNLLMIAWCVGIS